MPAHNKRIKAKPGGRCGRRTFRTSTRRFSKWTAIMPVQFYVRIGAHSLCVKSSTDKKTGNPHATHALAPLLSVFCSSLGRRGRAEEWRPAYRQNHTDGPVEPGSRNGTAGQSVGALKRDPQNRVGYTAICDDC